MILHLSAIHGIFDLRCQGVAVDDDSFTFDFCNIRVNRVNNFLLTVPGQLCIQFI